MPHFFQVSIAGIKFSLLRKHSPFKRFTFKSQLHKKLPAIISFQSLYRAQNRPFNSSSTAFYGGG
jgi:hypothetical protein